MSPVQWFSILPFWILGLPLVVGVVAYLKPRDTRGYLPPDRRHQRTNLIGDPFITAGDTVLFEG